MLRYYLGPGLRWANTLGPVPDSRIFDWRDAVSRLRATPPRQTLDQSDRRASRSGRTSSCSRPVFRDYRAWKSPLDEAGLADLGTSGRRCSRATPECSLVRQVTTDEVAVQENYFKLMQAFVYRRVR